MEIMSISKNRNKENFNNQQVADVIMEDDTFDPGFQGPYVGPVFTSKQKQFLSKMVDEKLMENEVEMNEYFNNVQMEMVRQFMIQKDELDNLIESNI